LYDLSIFLYLLEMLTGDCSPFTEFLVDEDNRGGDETEQKTETEDNGVSNPLWKGRFSRGEETGLPFVHLEGREDIVSVGEVNLVLETHDGDG
jgi:hypothetical protein